MATKYRETYQGEGGLEQAVIDLVRVGSTGFGSGVRQLASRLVRAVPQEVRDSDSFRNSIHEALQKATASDGLRFADGELPTSDDSDLPLAQVDPEPDGCGLTLPCAVMHRLEGILEERRRADELVRAGVPLTRTVMFYGEPGVGKTMAAHWLAREIGVPLVSLDLSAVSSSFLGHSGRNIRAVLDYAKMGPCVLLLDEFDALAKRRDDETDIGELKRVVNVVLVELDRWPDTSLLIAATNHPQLLDPAVDRRFDVAIEFPLPGLAERRAILSTLAVGLELDDSPVFDLTARTTDGMTGCDITRMWQAARRRSILSGTSTDEELLAEAVWHLHEPSELRDRAWLAVAEVLGWSNRQIAAKAGVSHPTVSSALKRARGELHDRPK